MIIRSEKMTSEEVKIIEESLAGTSYLFNRIVLTVCIFIGLLFFLPTKASSFIKLENSKISDLLSLDLDQMFSGLVIIFTVIILYLFYRYILTIPQIKADFKYKTKDIGIIKVKEIKELSARDKEDLLGTADYIMKFEKNPFKITETYFLSYRQPELLDIKAYQVEVSKYAKLEFKREIVEI